jgi:hypothetical protein
MDVMSGRCKAAGIEIFHDSRVAAHAGIFREFRCLFFSLD